MEPDEIFGKFFVQAMRFKCRLINIDLFMRKANTVGKRPGRGSPSLFFPSPLPAWATLTHLSFALLHRVLHGGARSEQEVRHVFDA